MKLKFTLIIIAILNISIAIAQNDTIYLEQSIKDLFSKRSAHVNLRASDQIIRMNKLNFTKSENKSVVTGSDKTDLVYFSIKTIAESSSGFLIDYAKNKAYNFKESKLGSFFVETDIEQVLPNEKGSLLHDHHSTKHYEYHDDQQLPLGNNLTANAYNLQSRSGAETAILLDFDGEDISGWGYRFPEVYDSEYTPDQMRKVWEVIAADFIMFNVNITTDHTVFDSYDETKKMKLVIGHCTGLNKVGGLSLVNIFGTGSGSLVNSKNSSEDLIAIAHIGSHEIGHGLGLFHDGTMWPGPSIPYYDGHADWAPIMGTSYGRKFVTWSLGEYEFASQAQDDLEIIGGHLGFAEDDKDAIQTLVTGKGDTLNREDNNGIIENRLDVDTFQFELTEEGPVDLNVGTSVEYTNLDVHITLENESGDVLTTDNPVGNRSGSIKETLPSGKYYLIIASGSENTANDGFTTYSSFGYYDINGSLPTSKKPDYDLSIAEVNGFKSLCGDEITGNIIIKNMGESPIDGGTLLVFVNDDLYSSHPISTTLDSKETFEFEELKVEELGANNLKFEVLAPSGVDELILSNNVYQTTYNLSSGTHIQFRTNLLTYNSESPFTWKISNGRALVNQSSSVEFEAGDIQVVQDFCLVEDCYEFEMFGDYNLCSAYPDYVAGQIYNAYDRVNYEGAIYESKWWNSNLPTASSWSKIRDCNEGSYYAELFNTEADSILLRVENELANEEFCMITLLTSMKEQTISDEVIIVWPNPSAGKFKIESDQMIEELVVFNFTGAKVLVEKPNSLSVNVDMTGLPSGIYFLKVNNEISTERIIFSK